MNLIDWNPPNLVSKFGEGSKWDKHGKKSDQLTS